MALGKIKLSHAQLLVLFWKESHHGVAILGENHVLIRSKITLQVAASTVYKKEKEKYML